MAAMDWPNGEPGSSPACPGAALAGWPIRPGGWRVLLLALGGGLGTVVRGFRRPGQFVDPRVLGGDTCLGGVIRLTGRKPEAYRSPR